MLVCYERRSVIAALLTLFIFLQYAAANLREKRVLTFLPSSPTRLQVSRSLLQDFRNHLFRLILHTFCQLIMGIGIPVDLEIESVTIGYVFKVLYFLPVNASNYINFIRDPFDLTTRPIGDPFERKRRGLNGSPLSSNTVLLEEPQPTEAPAALLGLGDDGHSSRPESASSAPDAVNATGFDSLLNQKFERYQVPVEEVESGTDSPTPPPPPSQSYGSPQLDRDNEADWLYDPLRAQSPDTSRWIVYKGIETLAARWVHKFFSHCEGRPIPLFSQQRT